MEPLPLQVLLAPAVRQAACLTRFGHVTTSAAALPGSRQPAPPSVPVTVKAAASGQLLTGRLPELPRYPVRHIHDPLRVVTSAVADDLGQLPGHFRQGLMRFLLARQGPVHRAG